MRFMSLVFKWRRLLFVLMAFEFVLMRLFYSFCFVFGGLIMVFFLCFGVVSRLLGLSMVIGGVFVFGNDSCVF